jgi:AraC-like DNA-binding protein
MARLALLRSAGGEHVRPVTSAAELLSAPIGRYLAGSWFVVWAYAPSLIGTHYFGQPDEQDFGELTQCFQLLSHSALAPKYDVLVDAGSVETVPPNAFEFLVQYLAVAKQSAGRMRRVSIVRPSGMFGATLAGVFYDVIRVQFAAGLFLDRSEGAHWLANPRAPRACRELDGVLDHIRATPPGLRRVREYLDRHLVDATLQGAARALKRSTRSLQRELRQANSGFRAEVERARMRAAERMLIDGSTKVESIARVVGYSKAAHFATAFRRVAGETPSQFRARRR